MATVMRIAGLPGLVLIVIFISMRLTYGPENYFVMFIREHKRARAIIAILIAIGVLSLLSLLLYE